MWEQLFLFCLLLFDVKAKEAYLESGSQEDVCENGKTWPLILNTEDNAVVFHESGFRYTGSDARQGLSVMQSSQFGDFVSTKLRKVMSSLSQVNPKAVLLRMATSLEVLLSRLVFTNPFLVALHILGKQIVTSLGGLGELLVLQTEMVMSQTLLDINLLRNDLVADFSKAATWLNQWWQVLNSVFESWLPGSNICFPLPGAIGFHQDFPLAEGREKRKGEEAFTE